MQAWSASTPPRSTAPTTARPSPRSAAPRLRPVQRQRDVHVDVRQHPERSGCRRDVRRLARLPHDRAGVAQLEQRGRQLLLRRTVRLRRRSWNSPTLAQRVRQSLQRLLPSSTTRASAAPTAATRARTLCYTYCQGAKVGTHPRATQAPRRARLRWLAVSTTSRMPSRPAAQAVATARTLAKTAAASARNYVT